MSRHRRKRETSDSFELFLDTITNTFGGVLLIALLIVLLIRESKENARHEVRSGPTEDIQVVQSEIDALEAQKAVLNANLLVQQQFEINFQSEKLKLLAVALKQVLTERSKFNQAANSVLMQCSRTQTELERVQSEAATQNQRIAKKATELDQLREQLRSEQKKRVRTISLPKERTTSKTEVPILIEGNELFIVYGNQPGDEIRVNRNFFERCSSFQADLLIDADYIRARSGKGISVESDRLGSVLGTYDKSTVFFTFVARPNSFQTFFHVRDACVKRGFEYRIIPTNGIVSESSGVRAKTQ